MVAYTASIRRFFLLLLLQVLVFTPMSIGGIEGFIYPLFILLLPLELPQLAILLVAFLHGLLIDACVDTLGLHAAISVLMAGLRPFILVFLEPRGGYEMGQSLTKHNLGARWFLQYSGLMLLIHIGGIILLQELTPSSVWLVRWILSWLFSVVLVVLYIFIVNPKS